MTRAICHALRAMPTSATSACASSLSLSLSLSSILSLHSSLFRYKRVLTNAVSVLRDGHCVAIVVANVRAKSDGRMLDLTSHTKLILEEAGCLLHEDAVLIEALGSAAQEASSAVRGGKLVSVHQNLIVCTKGDAPLNAERVGEFSIHPGPVTDSAMSKRAKRQSSAGVSNGGKMAKAAQSVEVSPPTCFDIPPRAMHGFVALSNDSRLQLFQRVMREPTVEQMRLYSAAMGGVSQDQCDLVTLKAIVREAERLDEVAAGCLTDLSLVTPIEKHGDVWAKRDDLLSVNGARGSKAAAVVLLAQQAKTRDGGLVVACSRVSTMLGRVARACEHVGVPCRLHISHGELGPEEVDALEHGATLVKHNISHLRMFEPRAKADATSRDWLYVPFGIECESHLASVRRQVRDIPVGVKRIVLAVGSGVTLAGLLQGLQERETAEPHLKKVRVLGVYVNNAPEELLDRLAPAGWRGRVELKGSGTKYADAAACGERMWSPAGHTRIKLDPFYEAKAKQHMQVCQAIFRSRPQHECNPNPVTIPPHPHAGRRLVLVDRHPFNCGRMRRKRNNERCMG
jgi:1-aminocyclopropane-1-carboxylate deaminase/D-cysteine desulfhydrase-like pyridoxal-dependent ACC family enzyme